MFLEIRDRHTAAIAATLKTPVAGDSDGQPRKYRKSAFEWLLAFHNGNLVANEAGIERLVVPAAKLKSFEDCWEWPGCNVAMDQGTLRLKNTTWINAYYENMNNITKTQTINKH